MTYFARPKIFSVIRLLKTCFYMIFLLVASLPSPLAYGAAVSFNDLSNKVAFRSKREEVKYAIQAVLGKQLGLDELNRVVRDFFRLRSCERVDVVKLDGKGQALMNLVEVRGTEHLKTALDEGKGAILCSAHFGSARSCYSLVGALGFPVTIIARWSYEQDRDMTPIQRLLFRLETEKPLTSHLRRPNFMQNEIFVAARAAMVLRKNEIIGIMLDWHGPTTFNFLNHQAKLATGAATLAQVTGAPLLLMLLRRTDWRHQVLEIFPPMHVEEDTVGAMQVLLTKLEVAIRQYPAHWRNFMYFSELGLIFEALFSKAKEKSTAP